MRTLLLMRHAKSRWKDESLADDERPLNERGKLAAARMGRFLAEHNLVPEAVVCSTAKRARQTAKRVKESAGCTVKTRKTATLYFHGSEAYLREAASLPGDVHTALLIGHNPDLESLVARLGGKHIDIPTATVVHLTADMSDWGDIADGRGLTLEGVYRPKEIDTKPNLRKARRPRRRPRTS